MSVVPVLHGEEFNAKHVRAAHGRFGPGMSRPKLLKRDERVIASAAETFRPRSISTPAHAVDYTAGKPRMHPQTVAAFHELASALRRGDTSDHRIAEADKAMTPTAHDLILTRHMPASAFGLRDDELGHLPEFLAGRKTVDRAFTPTALHQPNQPGGVTMHIAAPAGTRALLAGDNEMWLDRDAELAITGVHPNGHGGWTVEATVLPKESAGPAKKVAAKRTPAKKAVMPEATPAPAEARPPTVKKAAAPRKAATPRQPKPKVPSAEETVAKLRTVETRAEAHALVAGHTKAQLQASLDHFSEHHGRPGLKLYGSGDNKKTLQDRLVEATSGRRIDSEVISRPDEGRLSPLSPVGHADTGKEATTALAAHIRSGVVKRDDLGADHNPVELVTFADGTKAVHKRPTDAVASAEHQADAEKMSSLVAAAVGVRAPAVEKDGQRAVYMDYVDGTPAGDTLSFAETFKGAEGKKYANTDDGRLLGLLDILINNNDRHFGNWMITGDGHLAAIDHGFSFLGRQPYGQPRQDLSADVIPVFPDRFTRHYVAHDMATDATVWRDNDLSKADIAVIRQRINDLRPQFEAAGRGDWHDFILHRLGMVEAHATGTKTRLAT